MTGSPERIGVSVRLGAASAEDVATAVARHAASICQALGVAFIPSARDVAVVVQDAAEGGGAPEFFIDGRLVPYDERAKRQVLAYLGEDLSVPQTEAEYTGLLFRHALTAAPELLAAWVNPEGWLRVIPSTFALADIGILVSRLLRAHLAVDDPELAFGVNNIETLGEFYETCVASFSSERVLVRLSPLLFDDLDAPALEEQLNTAREPLWRVLGVLSPTIRVELEPSLRERSVDVVLNALPLSPSAVFGPNDAFVHDTVERLQLMNVTARAFVAPDLRIGSLVSTEARSSMEAIGLAVLSAAEYVAQIVQRELRDNAALLVHQDFVRYMLDTLWKAFPALTLPEPVWRLTEVLRELARDRIPIRDFETIVERVRDFPFEQDPASRHAILDDRLTLDNVAAADLYSFLRAGLARHAVHAFTRETNTLVAYLLDPDLTDAAINSGEVLSNSLQTTILKSIDAELSHLPPTASPPHVLTSAAAAMRLRPLLRIAYPQMAVLSYGEIPAAVNVQPVARISAVTASL